MTLRIIIYYFSLACAPLQAKALLQPPQGFDSCTFPLYQELFEAGLCTDLSDEVKSTVSFSLGNCFLNNSGREPFPSCPNNTKAPSCLSNADFALYTSIVHHLDNLCFYFQARFFHVFATHTLRNLVNTNSEALHLANSLSQSIQSLHSYHGDSAHVTSRHHRESLLSHSYAFWAVSLAIIFLLFGGRGNFLVAQGPLLAFFAALECLLVYRRGVVLNEGASLLDGFTNSLIPQYILPQPLLFVLKPLTPIALALAPMQGRLSLSNLQEGIDCLRRTWGCLALSLALSLWWLKLRETLPPRRNICKAATSTSVLAPSSRSSSRKRVSKSPKGD